MLLYSEIFVTINVLTIMFNDYVMCISGDTPKTYTDKEKKERKETNVEIAKSVLCGMVYTISYLLFSPYIFPTLYY